MLRVGNILRARGRNVRRERNGGNPACENQRRRVGLLTSQIILRHEAFHFIVYSIFYDTCGLRGEYTGGCAQICLVPYYSVGL